MIKTITCTGKTQVKLWTGECPECKTVIDADKCDLEVLQPIPETEWLVQWGLSSCPICNHKTVKLNPGWKTV